MGSWLKKPFIVFSVILVVKSYLAWLVIFGNKVSIMPLITEIPFVWLLFCLIEWFSSKRKLAVYLAVNLICSAVFFAAIMYYKYYGVIVTYHALNQVGQVTEVKSSIFSLMDPYYLFIFMDVIVLIYLLFRGKRVKIWKTMVSHKERKGFVLAMFIISLLISLTNVLPNRASMNEIVKAEGMGILNYEAYTILSSKKKELIDPKEITQSAIQSLKGIEDHADPQYKGAAAGKNVIILQLESFQNFLIGVTVDGKEITPNMNLLAKEHAYFPNFYQQVGQGNTSDAEYVVNTSLYIPEGGAATDVYVDKALPSLPKLMKANGYNTATFHTNYVNFWNRDKLYDALGFDRYYDQTFYGQDDMVFFGPSDEVLYAKTTDEMKRMADTGKPFYAHIISMSAHHPFTIPDRKYQMTLPKRYEGTLVGNYIRAQNYADYAIGQLIDNLKQAGLWDNSVIAIYGDHLGLPIYSLDKNDKALMEEIYGREYGYADMTNIPLIVVSPGVPAQELKQVGGQIDIMPTVANLTGVSMGDQLHFGEDLFNQTYNLLPQRYYLPSGSFMSGKTLFMPGKGFDDGTNYPLATAVQTDSPNTATVDEYERALKLLQMSDSYVLQLSNKP